MKIDFIVPAINEAEGIAQVLQSFPSEKLEDEGYEINKVVVDGGSDDGTQEIARENGAEVIVEERPGYGRAYKTGFEETDGDIIVTSDADTTYSLDKVPIMVYMVRNGYDFVSSNRLSDMSEGSMGLRNRMGNELLNAFCRIFYRAPFRDSQSGMWCFRRDILDELQVRSDGMPFSQEIKLEAHHRGLNVSELDIKYSRRKGEKELHPWSDGIGNLLHLFSKRLEHL